MRRLAWGLLIIWSLVFAASVLFPFMQEATGDGFTRGLNRVGTFFGLQFAAGLIAVFIWPLSKHLGSTRAALWLGRTPAIIAATLLVLVIAVILWVRFAKPPPSDYVPPERPVTQPVG